MTTKQLYTIVDEYDRVVEDLAGLSLDRAERELGRQITLGNEEVYITDYDATEHTNFKKVNNNA